MRSRKRFARVGSDFDFDLVGEDLGAAGHRAAVAARFANDGSAFAGDDGLIDRGDAFNHFAVAGNDVAGLGNDNVAGAQLGRRNGLDLVACG